MTKGMVSTLYGIDENWPVDTVIGLVLGFVLISLMSVTNISMGTPAPIYPLTTFAEQIGIVSTLIVIGFLAPIGEEALFRGIFIWFGWQNLKYFTVAIILSSLAFAAFHYSAYGAHLPAAYVGAFIVAILLSLITLQTRSLLPGIIIHSMININLYLQSEQLFALGL